MAAKSKAGASRRYQLDGGTVNLDRSTVTREGQAPVSLSGNELALLAALVQRPGETISEDELLRSMGRPPARGRRVITHIVRRLRLKLGEGDSGPSLVRTVRGRGWVVDASALATDQIIDLGARRVDLAAAIVTTPTGAIELTEVECDLLRELWSAKGEPRTRRELMTGMRGQGGGETRAVDNVVYRLRSKLEADRKRPRYLLSVRGHGYRMPRDEVPSDWPSFDEEFIGRLREQDALQTWLDSDQRALWVWGPAGAGKSRLVAECFRDEVARVWIDMAGVTAPGDVINRCAVALGIRVTEPTTVSISGLIDRARAIVIWDDIDASALASTVQECHQNLTQSRLVLTSRSTGPGGLPSLELAGLRPREARRFWAARTGHTAHEGLDELVDVLHGLPLLIELASARARTASPAELAARAKQGVHWLATDGKLSPAQLIQRQWDTLEAAHRDVIGAVSALSGSFDGAFLETLLGEQAEATLNALLEQSLVQRYRTDGGVRLRVYQLVREYAMRRDGSDAISDSVAAAVVSTLRPDIERANEAGGRRARQRLRAWSGNLERLSTRTSQPDIAAEAILLLHTAQGQSIPWVEQAARVPAVLDAGPSDAWHDELCVLLGRIQMLQGDTADAERTLDQIIGTGTAPERAKLILAACALLVGDDARATALLDEAEAADGQTAPLEIQALRLRADVLWVQQRWSASVPKYRESVDRALELGRLDLALRAGSAMAAAMALQEPHDTESSTWLERCIGWADDLDDHHEKAKSLATLGGGPATSEMNLTLARGLLEQARDMHDRNGSQRSYAICLTELAVVAILDRDLDEADRYLDEAIGLDAKAPKFVIKGLVSLMRREWESAIGWLDRAITDAKPETPIGRRARYFRLATCAALGRPTPWGDLAQQEETWFPAVAARAVALLSGGTDLPSDVSTAALDQWTSHLQRRQVTGTDWLCLHAAEAAGLEVPPHSGLQ